MSRINMKDELKNVGYFCDDSLAKKVSAFYNAGLRQEESIPCAFLTGAPGAGKTLLAEKLAAVATRNLAIEVSSLFLQMHKGIDAESMMTRPNTRAIIRKDAENAVQNGILIRGLVESQTRPVVITIDELDKAGADSDALLLDFLNSGRVTDGHETWRRGDHPIWVVITSNGNREIDDSLLNRCRRIPVERPDYKSVAELLGVPEDHHAISFYRDCPEMSIRQLRNYLSDIEYEDVFDAEIMSQYVDIDTVGSCDNAEDVEFRSRKMRDTAFPLTVTIKDERNGESECRDYTDTIVTVLTNWRRAVGDARATDGVSINICGDADEDAIYDILVFDVGLAKALTEAGVPLLMEERTSINYWAGSSAKNYTARLWVPNALIEARAETSTGALVKVGGKVLCGRWVDGYFLADLTSDDCNLMFGFSYSEERSEEDE